LDGRAGWEPKEWHDQYWHMHADRNNTAHYHYSGLLYLSMYREDFTGGRFLFYDAERWVLVGVRLSELRVLRVPCMSCACTSH